MRLPQPALAREIRVRAHVSMEQLAQEVGVSWSTVVRWETGKAVPRGDRLIRYVKALEDIQRELGVA